VTFKGTFYLLDPSFAGNAGHAMNFGGGVAAASAKLGFDMKMAVSNDMAAADAALYNALPVFSVTRQLSKVRYRLYRSGLRASFYTNYEEDLNRLAPMLSRDDLLWDYYLQGPMQVDAYSRWLEKFAPQDRPRVMVGVDVYYELWHDWLQPIVPRLKNLEPWFRVTSTSYTNTEQIRDQLGIKVEWMPRPKMGRVSSEQARDPQMSELLTAKDEISGPLVGFFADPTRLKSFHLLGDVVSALLPQSSLRFVVQLRGEPSEQDCIQSLEMLKKYAAEFPGRVIFVPAGLSYAAYKTALELCDGVMVAYDPESHFCDTPSGTVCEALAANTIPIVVEGSSMAKELRLFHMDFPVMPVQEAEDLLHLLGDFEKGHKDWLQRNRYHIKKWRQFQSHTNMFEHLFEKAWIS